MVPRIAHRLRCGQRIEVLWGDQRPGCAVEQGCHPQDPLQAEQSCSQLFGVPQAGKQYDKTSSTEAPESEEIATVMTCFM